MLILLPLLGAFILFWYFYRFRGICWRESWLNATVVWGVLVVLSVEGLSVLGALAAIPIALIWGMVCFAGVVLCYRAKRTPRAPVSANLDTADLMLLAGAGLIIAVNTFVALTVPPNVPDVLIYHMPRVAYWAQDHAVHRLASWNPSLTFEPPWAEFAMLHLFVLAGSDRFVNLVQIFSLAGCAIGASLVARRLGANLTGQVVAAVLAITIPEVVLESSSAKNDCVGAYWLIAAGFYTLAWLDRGKLPEMLALGACVALAVLTKGSAYFIAPAVVAGCCLAVPLQSWKRWVIPIPAVLALVLLLNCGQYVRNWRAFHSPLGCTSAECTGVYRFGNDRITPGVLFSNALRNAALHLYTPSENLSRQIYKAVNTAISDVGEDINDPATTWKDTKFEMGSANRDEHVASNTSHVLLLMLSIVLAVVSVRKLPNRRLILGYAGGVLTAFVLFCAVLRWQPWNTRLHIPLFVLWCPFIAVVLMSRLPRTAVSIIAVFLLMGAWPFAIENRERPLAGASSAWDASIVNKQRGELYDTYHGNGYDAGLKIAGLLAVSQCRSVAIQGRYEYPVMAGMGVGTTGAHILDIRGGPGSTYNPHNHVCAIVCLYCSAPDVDRYKSLGKTVDVFDGYLLVRGVDADWSPPDAWTRQ